LVVLVRNRRRGAGAGGASPVSPAHGWSESFTDSVAVVVGTSSSATRMRDWP
jgi:hypothetical protein